MRVVGARIRALREDRGWDAGVLAYKTGVSASYIYKLETGGRANASADILGRMADALETTIEYLIGATNDPAPLAARTLDVDLSPEHLLRLQRFVERVARLPQERQQVVMDALMTLLNVEDALRNVQEDRLFSEPEEDRPSSS